MCKDERFFSTLQKFQIQKIESEVRTANSVSLLGYANTTVDTSDQSQLWQPAYQLAISTSREAHCA